MTSYTLSPLVRRHMKTLKGASRLPATHGQAILLNDRSPSHTDVGLSNYLAELLDPKMHPPLDLSQNHQNRFLPEIADSVSGPSPFRTVFNGRGLFLTTEALGYLPESPPFEIDQFGSPWGRPQPPFLDQGSHHSSRKVRSHIPGADLILGNGFVTDLLPDFGSFPCGLLSEQLYQEPEDVGVWGEAQASETSMDLTTSYQTFVGHPAPLGDLTKFPVNGLGSPAETSSVSRDEEAAPTNSRSLGQGKHHPINESNQGVPAGRKFGIFRCHICDVNFAQGQGLNRHNRDKHEPREICPHCGIFGWSSARNYLLTRHIKKCHPELDAKPPRFGPATTQLQARRGSVKVPRRFRI